ncbi:MAG TPA: response regulator [Elusimicrobiales bacterium]|nr:response regulator [Elusimicrobiales bacterium]
MAKKHLLLIEDEGYVIDRVNDILKEFPQFEVTNCCDADEARRHLADRPFEVVITDIYLRGVSGLELSFKAREKNPEACVIIITGLDNIELATKALKEGALDFIMKPPGLERLTNILKLVTLVKGLAPAQ